LHCISSYTLNDPSAATCRVSAAREALNFLLIAVCQTGLIPWEVIACCTAGAPLIIAISEAAESHGLCWLA